MGIIFITRAWRRDWKHSYHLNHFKLSVFEMANAILKLGKWGEICTIKGKGVESCTTKLKGEGKGVGEIGKIKSFLIRRDLETRVCSEDFVYFDFNQF